MTRISELKGRLLDDPAFRAEYATADAEYSIIEALIGARHAANLSQAELARRIGSTQSASSRGVATSSSPG